MVQYFNTSIFQIIFETSNLWMKEKIQEFNIFNQIYLLVNFCSHILNNYKNQNQKSVVIFDKQLITG